MNQPFTIFVIQSAHTDIGYTHPQEQIADMYLDHYDLVLDLCRRTADAPEAQRFKWVCETFWQVEHYLAHRPERREEFLKYVRAGQIEVTAAYLHFTDLIDADAYRRSLQAALDFGQHNGVPVNGLLHCDINGWPWALADILAESHIPYFCSQVHIDMTTDPLGKRGSVHYHWLLEMPDVRPDAPTRVPQAFWWQGPKGGRVLHWLNEHYLLGNVLGVSSPKPFGADKTRFFYETDQLTDDDLYFRAQREVPRFVSRLKENGYQRDSVLLSTGGFYVDNSRPDHRWCEVIARWNAEHHDICLRTATLSEWFAALTAQSTDNLPVMDVAWPDGWAHGLGSMTARIAQARRTQRRRANVLKVVEQAQSAKATDYLNQALGHERFALEHTFCAWSTSARPEAAVNAFQQAVKEITFHRAELYLDEATAAALHSLIPDRQNQLHLPQGDPPGLRSVHFDPGDQRLDPNQQILIGADGQRYPIQVDNQSLGQLVAVLPVSEALSSFQLADAPVVRRPIRAAALELNTAAWTVRLDSRTGGLASLCEKASGHEWVASDARYAFGQLVHEAVVQPLGRAAVGNLAHLIAADVATDEARRRFALTPVFEHTTPAITGEPVYTEGPVFDEIRVAGSAARIGDVTFSWRGYHALPIVELVIDWHKVWCDLPEAAYVAFPFAAPNARLALETSGGFFQPGEHGVKGQLPGTCSTYYTVQRAARITDGDARLFWLPLDAPLVMPNEINFNHWETMPWQWNGFLASMPVNHYWHTNFPTSQSGFLRLRYRFSPGAATDEAALLSALPVDALGWR